LTQKTNRLPKYQQDPEEQCCPNGLSSDVWRVGAGVGLAPVPATIADLMPQTGLESAMVKGQVVLATPWAKKWWL
jgi:hypothetical protein